MIHASGTTILAARLLLDLGGDAAWAQDKPRPGDSDRVLPTVAVGRLGTTRFRHGDTVRLIGVADIHRSIQGDTTIKFLTFTPDGKAVGAASWDRSIHFFHVKTGEAVRQFGSKELPASLFALSPDGKTLAAGDDRIVRLYDFA